MGIGATFNQAPREDFALLIQLPGSARGLDAPAGGIKIYGSMAISNFPVRRTFPKNNNNANVVGQ